MNDVDNLASSGSTTPDRESVRPREGLSNEERDLLLWALEAQQEDLQFENTSISFARDHIKKRLFLLKVIARARRVLGLPPLEEAHPILARDPLIEPLLVGREQPHEAGLSTEAKTK